VNHLPRNQVARHISLSVRRLTSQDKFRRELAGKETIVNELVQLVQQRTGLSQDVAQTVVNTVMEHLKSRLPASMSAGLDQLMGSGTSSPDDASKGGMLETAESMISGMMGSKQA